MLEQKVVETAVKHIVARSTKQFFGYGPAERVHVVVQGELVIFATRFSGLGILEALPQTPFGRLAMRHIAGLFSQEVEPELIRLAREEFGIGLTAILSDLDHETGQSLGIALLEQPLSPSDHPADLELSCMLTEALADAAKSIGVPPAGPASVRTGSGVLVLRAPRLAVPALAVPALAPHPALPGGDVAEAEFAALSAMETFRARLRAGLLNSLAAARLTAGPVFVTNGRAGLLAGALLTR